MLFIFETTDAGTLFTNIIFNKRMAHLANKVDPLVVENNIKGFEILNSVGFAFSPIYIISFHSHLHNFDKQDRILGIDKCVKFSKELRLPVYHVQCTNILYRLIIINIS